jgi:translation initiation factor 1
VGRGPETRLVYSTGGEVSEESTADETPEADGRRIRLKLDRRASGRVVTVVSGLPGSAAAIGSLAKQLKAACGAGGSVKDGVLELQGDHRDRVEAALRARGLNSKRSGG